MPPSEGTEENSLPSTEQSVGKENETASNHVETAKSKRALLSASTSMMNDTLAAVKNAKRRRHSMFIPSSNNHWASKGTQLKTMLDGVVHYSLQSTTSQDSNGSAQHHNDNDDEEEDTMEGPAVQSYQEVAAALAREKTSEAMLLQRQLQQATSQSDTLQATNDSLRQEVNGLQQRLDRTMEALRIAGSNAAKAREDADQAEATVTTLAQNLQSLQSVITETKHASNILQNDQANVTRQAQLVQTKLIQKETELARQRMTLQKVQKAHAQLVAQQDEYKQANVSLKEELTGLRQEQSKLQHELSTQHALEEARQNRHQALQEQLSEAQSLTQQATTAQTKSEEAIVALQQTIQLLQRANQDLHKVNQEQQEGYRRQEESWSNQLEQAQQEVQSLHLTRDAQAEELEASSAAKLKAETALADMQTQVANLERELRTSKETVLPQTPTFTIPSLKQSNTTPAKDQCCICFQAVHALFKKCQCGQTDCQLKAHAACAALHNVGPSVSHPGTPAPPLPRIFCSKPKE